MAKIDEFNGARSGRLVKEDSSIINEADIIESIQTEQLAQGVSLDTISENAGEINSIDYVAGKSGIDSITEVLITIPFEHHEIHSGSHFIACDKINLSTSTQKYMVVTPATTKYAHMIFDVECTGEVSILVTEGADRVAGSALTAINRNRNILTAATTAISKTPTDGATDGAVTILTKRVGSTGVGNRTGNTGGARGANEFVLKANTKYIVAIQTFADVWITTCFDWYEHTDKTA